MESNYLAPIHSSYDRVSYSTLRSRNPELARKASSSVPYRRADPLNHHGTTTSGEAEAATHARTRGSGQQEALGRSLPEALHPSWILLAGATAPPKRTISARPVPVTTTLPSPTRGMMEQKLTKARAVAHSSKVARTMSDMSVSVGRARRDNGTKASVAYRQNTRLFSTELQLCCPVRMCRERFADDAVLIHHLETTHQKGPKSGYRCPECDAVLSRKWDFRCHFKRKKYEMCRLILEAIVPGGLDGLKDTYELFFESASP